MHGGLLPLSSLVALESAFHPCFSLANWYQPDVLHEAGEPGPLHSLVQGYGHLRQVCNFCISCFQIFACFRTALEICKVLLTLDPGMDPLTIVLLVNFYALLLPVVD